MAKVRRAMVQHTEMRVTCSEVVDCSIDGTQRLKVHDIADMIYIYIHTYISIYIYIIIIILIIILILIYIYIYCDMIQYLNISPDFCRRSINPWRHITLTRIDLLSGQTATRALPGPHNE